MLKKINLHTVDSTNSEAKRMAAHEDGPLLISAFEQTAGRGQRGNSWEAAPGENATFSLALHPSGVDARSQFVISQATAIGILKALRSFLAGKVEPQRIRIKWPNDIYVDNRKICGVLIESAITGNRIERVIIGVGVNVNQTVFVSDAPNPVSMAMLTGEVYDVDAVTDAVAECIVREVAEIDIPHGDAPSAKAGCERIYNDLLWRKDEIHQYMDASTGETFAARIIGAQPTGHLMLHADSGEVRQYAFKEVVYII